MANGNEPSEELLKELRRQYNNADPDTPIMGRRQEDLLPSPLDTLNHQVRRADEKLQRASK